MGTEYIICKDEVRELCIGEMSNTLELYMATRNSGRIFILKPECPPAEVMKIFLEGIKVCSYWMNTREFDETLALLENYSYEE